MPSSHIVVAGAGSIGCFVGGLLAAGGRSVTLLGRRQILDGVNNDGLMVSDYSGLSQHIPASKLTLSDDPACLEQADLVLVAVKTGASRAMGDLVADHAPDHAIVVSLQNGLDAVAVLRAALPGRDVRAGMVPFNVVPLQHGHYHRASSGDILIGAGSGGLQEVLSVPHLAVAEIGEITGYQWGKLLINLSNAPNALSGLTVHEQLLDRAWRCLIADQMVEALRVLDAAHIPLRLALPIAPSWVPTLLRLPTVLFRKIAAQMLTIDPTALSSMAYDLNAGRFTEVDALQGAIVALGLAHGVATPLNAHIAELVHAAEVAGPGRPKFGPDDLRPG